MNERKKKRIKKQIVIFLSVLSFVLFVGITAMVIYSENSNNNNPIIDFGFMNFGTEDENKKEISEKNVAEDSAHEVLNGEIYNEAISLGQKVFLPQCTDDESITFAFAGDVLLDENYANTSNFISRGSSIEDTFSSDLLKTMINADVFMLNNEFTFTDRGSPTPDKAFTFRAQPQRVDFLKEIGVDVVSLANNHAYDFGEISLVDTIDTLQNAGISYVGAGKNLEEAMKPVYVIANGMKIAIVSATQIERTAVPDTKEATANSAGVLRCMDSTALLSVIEEAENNSDFTILYIHWGTENKEETDWLQEEQAPVYAQAGVDLIIGAHPHCLQKIDFISGVPVVYSLGNFWFNSKTVNTGVFEVNFTKNGIETMKFVPCVQQDCRTRQLSGEEKETVLEYMRSISPNVHIDSDGYVSNASKK